MHTGDIKIITNPGKVATVSVKERQVRVAEVATNTPTNPPEENGQENIDDDASIQSLYSCNYCHNFGIEGNRCQRCGEDSGCYYIGEKMTEQKMNEAIELMKKEDNEQEEEEEDNETD